MPITRLKSFYMFVFVTFIAAIAICPPCWAEQSQSPAPWWKGAVVYEIFVRSYQDSNGDGVGDLNGITSRLDYLQSLGVDAIWLTPCFPSPKIDFGYDVADYTNIAPEYGTLEDFDGLVREARKRNIHILLDFVINHSSDQNPWFKESRASKTSAKRDWYMWRDGRGPGQPPNDWQSEFGGPAWTLDKATGQYYFHRFWPEQPDLNWRNAEVRSAMYDVVRFWLKRGVAGFRVDAVPSLFEDPNISDPSDRFDKMPETHTVLRELRKVVDEFPGNRVLIGETYTNNAKELAVWYGKGDEIHLPLSFPFNGVNKVSGPGYRKRLADEQEYLSSAWPTHFLSSHDEARHIDRLGDGIHDQEIAKLMATLLLTARGTPVLYYGEEIGMVTTTPTRVEDVKDMDGIRNWPAKKGRDGERTPMQWDGNAGAGFTSGKPWLPIPSSSARTNVAAEQAQSDSLLSYYKQLTAARRNYPALRLGDYVPINVGDEDVLAYERRDHAGDKVVIVLNMSAKNKSVKLPNLTPSVRLRALVRSYSNPGGALRTDKIDLAPYGALVAAVE